jgi:hypothetical protein
MTHPLPVLPPVSQSLGSGLPPDIRAETGDKSSTQFGFDVLDERNKAWTDNHFREIRPHHVTVIRHRPRVLHHKLFQSSSANTLSWRD